MPTGLPRPAPEAQCALARASAELGWAFARWDGAVDDDGAWWWCGVDPQPDYRVDDGGLGGVLSDRLADVLTAGAGRVAATPPGPHPTTRRALRPSNSDCRTGQRTCPCGAEDRRAVLDDMLAAAHRRTDEGLERPEEWRGSMRRENLRYGTAAERSRHQEAFNHLAASGGDLPDLTVDRLRELHARGVGDGALRREQLWIPGGHTFPHPASVPPLLADLCEGYEENRRAACTYSTVLHLHLGLLVIHPFLDGNGRLSRLAAARELMRSGYWSVPFTVIDGHYRAWPSLYTELLSAYDEGWICRSACLSAMQLAALAHLFEATASTPSERTAIARCLSETEGSRLGRLAAPLTAALRGQGAWC